MNTSVGIRYLWLGKLFLLLASGHGIVERPLDKMWVLISLLTHRKNPGILHDLIKHFVSECQPVLVFC